MSKRISVVPPPSGRKSKATVKRSVKSNLSSPSLESKNAIHSRRGGSGPIHTALRTASAIGGGLRSAWQGIVRSLDNGSFPLPPSHRNLGLADAPLFASLEPTELGMAGSAPAAVSDRISRYAQIVGSDMNMRIAFRQPLCHVGRGGAVSTLAVPGILMLGTNAAATPSAAHYANVIGLNPLRNEYFAQVGTTTFDQGVMFSDAFTASDIAFGFSMWRFVGDLVFHYEPQSSTASTTRIDMAYTEDAAHPVLGLTNHGVNAPQPVNIDSTPYSVAFAPWNSWTLRVPADPTWKYCYGAPAYAVAQTSIVFPSSDVRFTNSGAITIGITGGTTGDVYGRILMECEVEYKDPAPAGAVITYLTTEKYMSVLKDSVTPPDPPVTRDTDSKELVSDDDFTPKSGPSPFVKLPRRDPPPPPAPPSSSSSSSSTSSPNFTIPTMRR